MLKALPFSCEEKKLNLVQKQIDGKKNNLIAKAMAVQSIAKPDPLQRSETLITKISKNRKIAFAFALLFADAFLVALIIAYIPCKIHSLVSLCIYI